MSATTQPGTWWVEIETRAVLHLICACGQELLLSYDLVEDSVLPDIQCCACGKHFSARLEGWAPPAGRPRSPTMEL
ncbi:MAG: hypothetical protein P1V51_24540 [Deltaproteobacteria bacterium]|nr:hypothetical protein [Deltaproteobacteria bacterium]